MLKTVLGAHFLEPLEESDRVIELEAKQPRAERIVADALDGVATPPISVATFVYLQRDVENSLVDPDERLVRKIASTESLSHSLRAWPSLES